MDRDRAAVSFEEAPEEKPRAAAIEAWCATLATPLEAWVSGFAPEEAGNDAL
jgi:hypothetical protein